MDPEAFWVEPVTPALWKPWISERLSDAVAVTL